MPDTTPISPAPIAGAMASALGAALLNESSQATTTPVVDAGDAGNHITVNPDKVPPALARARSARKQRTTPRTTSEAPAEEPSDRNPQEEAAAAAAAQTPEASAETPAEAVVQRVLASDLLQHSVVRNRLVRRVLSEAERLAQAQDCVDVLCIGMTKDVAASTAGRLLHPFSPIRLTITDAAGVSRTYPSAAALAIASLWPAFAEAAQQLPGQPARKRHLTPILAGPAAMAWLSAQCNRATYDWMTSPDTHSWKLREHLIEATWARLLCYSDTPDFQRLISALPVVPEMDEGYAGATPMTPIKAKNLPLVMWDIKSDGTRIPHPMSSWWVGTARKMMGWAGSAWRTGQANADALNRHADAMAAWHAGGERGPRPAEPKKFSFDPSDEIQVLARLLRPVNE